MRELRADTITAAVKELFLEANYIIGKDIRRTLAGCMDSEESPVGKSILGQIIENDDIAAAERIAICQDTGMSIVFIELGQDVHIIGGGLEEAVNQGVRDAYGEGYLRKSVVDDPLFDRANTRDNTPAIIHLKMVPGTNIRIIASPKGFGSENMSAVKMLKPADGVRGVMDFVTATAVNAGPNPCPPIIVGVGIGGTLEKAAQIAKFATLRPVDRTNRDERYARLERDILESINKSGVGPGGLGGRTTALAVHIEFFPTHIAGLPVAVNICCHAARHAETTL